MINNNEIDKMYQHALKTLNSVDANSLMTKFKRSVVVTVILDDENNMYTGINIGWWHSTCSEHTALANFFLKNGKNIKIVLSLKKHHTKEDLILTSPCGICRQMFAEMKFNPMFVIGKQNDTYILKSLNELLPFEC